MSQTLPIAKSALPLRQPSEHKKPDGSGKAVRIGPATNGVRRLSHRQPQDVPAAPPADSGVRQGSREQEVVPGSSSEQPRGQSTDTEAPDAVQTELADLKKTVATFEAFFAVSLVNKLDGIITEKLGILETMRRSKARVRRLFFLSFAFNAGLLGLLATEYDLGSIIAQIDWSAQSNWIIAEADIYLQRIRAFFYLQADPVSETLRGTAYLTDLRL